MKLCTILITILLCTISSTSWGGNWVGKSNVKSPSKVWKMKNRCESQEGELCFDRSGKDMRRWMIVADVLVPDSAGGAAADAEDAQKASDNSARNTAKGNRGIQLITCKDLTVTKTGALTGPQVKKCIRAILRELRGLKVPVSDL